MHGVVNGQVQRINLCAAVGIDVTVCIDAALRESFSVPDVALASGYSN